MTPAASSPRPQPSPVRQPWLWAVGPKLDNLNPGSQIAQRYEVVGPQIWRDTQAAVPPPVPPEIPASALPYLKAHAYRLHLPSLYSITQTDKGHSVLLLDNVPIDRSGQLMSNLTAAWGSATAVRQLHWLWQLWQLWQPLDALDVAASLLDLENLHVEGWRLRLRQLNSPPPKSKVARPQLAQAAESWRPLATSAQPRVSDQLQDWLDQLAAATTDPEIDRCTHQLNRLLLEQTVNLPVHLRIAGGTTPGHPQRHNEDACYPNETEPDPEPSLRLGIVCDGIGGHEGGEVASQIIVRSLRLQLQALVNEVAQQDELLPPEHITAQIQAAIRVANNLVAQQNDQDGRSERQRMGTTLVMALHLRQRISTPSGWGQTQELYVIHVGDSRAYWITPHYCHQLTVDDDIASREVMAGRSFYPQAQARPGGGALTQAIGTRDANFLQPHIQRLVLDEEGVVLLCSDGLSDNQRVEAAWGNYIGLIVKNIISIPDAVASWLELATQQNGHDNASVVLLHCKVFPEAVPQTTPEPQASALATQQDVNPEDELTEASKALLYGEADEPDGAEAGEEDGPVPAPSPLITILTAMFGVAIVLGAGLLVWWQFTRGTPDPPAPPEPSSTQPIEPRERSRES